MSATAAAAIFTAAAAAARLPVSAIEGHPRTTVPRTEDAAERRSYMSEVIALTIHVQAKQRTHTSAVPGHAPNAAPADAAFTAAAAGAAGNRNS